MKKCLLILLTICSLALGLLSGCSDNSYSIMQSTEKAKNQLDFTYKVPSYLPTGYKLIQETYSPPKRTKFENREVFVSGMAKLVYSKSKEGYLTFSVTSHLASSGPAPIDAATFEVGSITVTMRKIDRQHFYDWDRQNLRYTLQAERGFSLSEVKKIIQSTF